MLNYKNIRWNKLYVCLLIMSCSCASFGFLTEPDVEEKKQETFYDKTGHNLMKIFSKDHKLGYIYDDGVFTKKVWGGKVVENKFGVTHKFTFQRRDFDSLRLLLGSDFEIGPELETVHHVVLSVENMQQYHLEDIQPRLEFMGKESRELLEQDFIVSMIKATRYSVTAFRKVMGELGAEYYPHPLVKIRGRTGTENSREESEVGYDLVIGYKVYNGSDWINNFESLPKATVWILEPEQDAMVTQVRSRIKGSLIDYLDLEEDYRNRLRLYIMTRNEMEDDWILQSKARIDHDGNFEGIVQLGDFEKGNGHRYSIAAFVSYFDINREVNSTFPFLPFNKGKFILNVKRVDDF